jgi:predicted secreted hydrolase
MKIKLKKIDAIIVVALLIIAGFFLGKAGYISIPLLEPEEPPPKEQNITSPPPDVLTPPNSFIPSFRRDVSPDDEGVHYDKIRISREWWYFGAVFNDEDSDLKDWTVAISFNHMAQGDLIGTFKPDLLVVILNGENGEIYGGMINKKRYLGILNSGTLIASSPGVNVQFEDSWAEGEYPNWHVHAEDNDIDNNNEIIIDLNYKTTSLPIWTIGTRAFDKSKSSIANYLFIGCEVNGTVELNGQTFYVKGVGHHEHAWSPKSVTKGLINGWDWFHITLDNGWNIYQSNYYPTPQYITTKTSKINPFGTFLITTDRGETLTELKNVDLKITREDNKIFPFVRMPADFSISAQPSLNPIYVISQSLLYGTNTKLEGDIKIKNAYNKVWKFPTYMGMKIGSCTLEGTLSWIDDEGEHQMQIQGIGISWNMRALL